MGENAQDRKLPRYLVEEIAADDELLRELAADQKFQDNLHCEEIGGMLVAISGEITDEDRSDMSEYFVFLRKQRDQRIRQREGDPKGPYHR
ncbi:MAG TPA: hypothetical protein VJJ78_00135 [Candidatus Saccharimonadales bacterium]|nr:hypothetical protein [Candidatus Saccharimonadales bacterium]